jgi:signal transduction histidine kinase/CheY-like chemotaxis protein
MYKIINVLFVLLFLIVFGSETSAQTKNSINAKVDKLLTQADLFLDSGDFDESLISSRQSLKYATLLQNDSLISTSYNQIARNFHDFDQIDKAILYYKKGLFYADKVDNFKMKATFCNNIGIAYIFDKKQHLKGIDYCNKSILYSDKIADTSSIMLTKLNLVWAYFDKGQFGKGLPHLKYINKYQSKFGQKFTIPIFQMLNGMYFGSIGDNSKAHFSFKQAILTAKKSNQQSELLNSYYEYSRFLFKIGDYKKAYINLELFKNIDEELYNKEKLDRANFVGANLQLDEYKREIDKIENENKLQEESIRKSRIILVLMYIVLGVLLLLLYSLFRNDRFKKKINAELTLANEALVIAKDNAIEASKLKSQFVSTISHELRTPLYGVVGITNMLLEEHKELADSPHLASLKFSARYLLSLVNDVLQINKIEENRIVLENLTFNISDEISMIKNSLTFLAKNNENELTLEIDPAIPESLIGDKLRFSQILMNLVSNALKFTKKGEVKIIANLTKVEDKSHFIEFQIKDNGPGISESDQVKIFDKFVQVGRNNTDYQGTGLGLSIVKQMLGLFNSTISLESKIGEGSNFIFTIAFDYDPEKTLEIINNIQVDLSEKHAYKVLVVEDNKINQLVTQKIMKKNNYFCTLADDGFQALEILENDIFDIILMDINMPVMNGFETSRKIRNKGITTPIIALTAFTKSEIIEESISVGINDIIIKPFEPVQLFQVINDQIYKAKNQTDS